jgi:MAF protein
MLRSRERLVLGSSSATRRRVLATALDSESEFEVVKGNVDEHALGDRNKPRELVQLLARTKAHDVLARLSSEGVTNALILASDQVVLTDDGDTLEKPQDERSARLRMQRFAGSTVYTLGAICAFDVLTNAEATATDLATVRFNDYGIDNESIEQLIAEGDVMHSSGALTVEHELVWPHVTLIDCTLDSVLGLGIGALERAVEGAIGETHA